ncbi:hypothetical protein [Acidaminococcus timonensis]|uniref:hypothetical protein n=1 Tax=Acidaminococcus timonensis TaxID=1871002 RepID=UPI0008D9C631|nr:hypothetical protein [Acidaminococcus timonensis]
MERDILTNVHSAADEYYERQVVKPTTARVHAVQLDQDAEEYFPLQPIEKKLCAYSLGLGLVLMAVFILFFEVL